MPQKARAIQNHEQLTEKIAINKGPADCFESLTKTEFFLKKKDNLQRFCLSGGDDGFRCDGGGFPRAAVASVVLQTHLPSMFFRNLVPLFLALFPFQSVPRIFLLLARHFSLLLILVLSPLELFSRPRSFLTFKLSHLSPSFALFSQFSPTKNPQLSLGFSSPAANKSFFISRHTCPAVTSSFSFVLPRFSAVTSISLLPFSSATTRSSSRHLLLVALSQTPRSYFSFLLSSSCPPPT